MIYRVLIEGSLKSGVEMLEYQLFMTLRSLNWIYKSLFFNSTRKATAELEFFSQDWLLFEIRIGFDSA
jgi:hypothetical protein